MNSPLQMVSSDARLAQEILKPILYADIFDYPLTFAQIYRFLECETTPQLAQTMLAGAVESGQIMQIDGFYSLVGRPELAATRRKRELIARRLWPKASHYGRWLASLPFVRMVAVTGSLAVENPRSPVDDIDYLIVTHPGRLWLCRAMIILMVRYGYLRGVHLCPNYIITENVIQFKSQTLFVAREMMQMQPLYGKQLYLKMRALNSWVTHFFPQGNGLNLERVDDSLPVGLRFLKKIGEFMLQDFLGSWLERQLQRIQIGKHLRRAEKYGALDKVVFTADVCKGHYDGHGHKTMGAYRQRVEKYKISP